MAAATGGDTAAVQAYLRRLPGLGARVVLGPAAPQMRQALQLLNGSGALGFLADQVTVVVDVGRLDWSSPAIPLACSADVLLVLTGGRPEALDAVAARREDLLGLPGPRDHVLLVTTGDPGFGRGEIEDAVGLPVAAHLPGDRRAAAVLTGAAAAARGWARLPLPRAVASLARVLDARPGTAGVSMANPQAAGHPAGGRARWLGAS
jgi:hypothetical protein